MFKEWRTMLHTRKYDMKNDLTSSQAIIIKFECTDNYCLNKLYHETAAAKY